MRILVVDDNIHVLEILSIILDRSDVVIDLVETCMVAKGLLRAHAYDWAVVDLHLPDGTGFDLLALLQEERSFTRTLLLTGEVCSEELRAQAIALGAEGVLHKPIYKRELLRYIYGCVCAEE